MKLLWGTKDEQPNALFVGVAGTFGKTSTIHLLADLLEKGERKVGIVSSIGSGIVGKELNKDVTANSLAKKNASKTIDDIVAQGTDIILLEMTTDAIEKGVFKDLQLDSAIITNILYDPEEYETWDAYAENKLSIIKQIRDGGMLVINGDEEDTRRWLSAHDLELPNNIYCYWTSFENLYDVTTRLEDMSFTIGGLGEFSSRIPGIFNALNMYQAAKIAELYIHKDALLKAAADSKPIKGRMETIYASPFTVMVDNAYSPTTLEQSLSYIAAHKPPSSKIIAVVGVKGFKAHQHHFIGDTAAKYADYVIVTSNDPIDEDITELNTAIVNGAANLGGALVERFSSSEEFEMADTKRTSGRMRGLYMENQTPIVTFDHEDFNGRLDAIRYAFIHANPGDILYIAGKGSDTSTRYKDIEYEWSEHEAAKIALDEVLRAV